MKTFEITITDKQAASIHALAEQLGLTFEQTIEQALRNYFSTLEGISDDARAKVNLITVKVVAEDVREEALRVIQRQDETFVRLAAEETFERIAADEAISAEDVTSAQPDSGDTE